MIDQNCSLERIKYKLDSSLHGWPTFTKHCDGNLEIIYITLKERQCKLSIGSYVDCLEEDPDLSILHLQISKKKDIWPMGRSIGKGSLGGWSDILCPRQDDPIVKRPIKDGLSLFSPTFWLENSRRWRRISISLGADQVKYD